MRQRQPIQNLLNGQAGVHRVAVELLLRGINVWFPTVDVGVDLMAEGGVRIQVKSTHIAYFKPYPKGAYWFHLRQGPIASGKNNIRVRAPRKFSEQCDFVVLWGIDQDRFFIVPSADVDGAQCLVVGPPVAWKELDTERIKELRSQRLTQEQVASRMGVQQMTISNRERGAKGSKRPSRSAKARCNEGRWELIQSCISSMEEANRAVAERATVVGS